MKYVTSAISILTFCLLPGVLSLASADEKRLFAAPVSCPDFPTAGPFSPSALMASVAAYDAMGWHRTGTEGERQAAQWLQAHLSAAGFSVQQQTFGLSLYLPDEVTITLAGEASNTESIAATALWPPIWTRAEGVTAPIRLFRLEQPSRVKASIALLELPFRRHSSVHQLGILAALKEAQAAGAVAIIARSQGPTGERLALNSDIQRAELSIPVLVVGPRESAALWQAALQEDQVNVKVLGKGPQAAQVHNVIGVLDRGGKPVVISTPLSGWFYSAAERGPGLAIFRALARWVPQAFPDYSFIFVATTGHELGNLGSHQYLQRLAPDPEDTALWLHLGAGLAARDFQEFGPVLLPLPGADAQRFLAGNGGTVPLLRRVFQGISGLEQAYRAEPDNTAGELRTILEAGYRPVVGAFGAHYYHHSLMDRSDKTDGCMLAPVALGFRTLLSELL